MLRSLLFLVGVLTITGRTVGQDANPPPVAEAGQEVLNFGLLDYRGKFYELRRADASVVVLFFTGNGCPIARQCITKVRGLRSAFADKGAMFWMINSNPQDDRQSIREEAQEFKIGSIPVLMDDNGGVARLLGVKRTAEAIAISTKDFRIIYRGAIDDQLMEGAKKEKAERKYLQTALEEFYAGKQVSVPRTKVHGCLIKTETPPLTETFYADKVVPLLQKKCVNCHSPGNIGPWSMSSYKKVHGMSEMMREVILSRSMPPWHADPAYSKFQNNVSLTIDEANTLLGWIEAGAPRGTGPDLLTNAPPKDTEWALGMPDHVIALPARQSIPATGLLDYRYIDADWEVPHDMWIRAAVASPDNRSVVHHIIVRVIPPKGSEHEETEEVFFTSWAPGNTLLAFPENTGKFLPKGARFNFEMHYSTTGKPEKDQSKLGLYVMKQQPKLILETRTAEARDLDIKPGEPEAKSFCLYAFKRDTIIYDLIPHMHLRGATFKYEALYPTGKRETLLSVPNYDFNWQTIYRLATPLQVPAGTWLLCTGSHDNSSKNPHNPDPKKRVKWGLQSYDEMFMGFMNVADAPQGSQFSSKQAKAR